MKIIPIIATLAALPLLAQQPAQDTTTPPPATVKCSQCGSDTAGQCPQAALAAAVGFQKGFLMGFEAGLDQAAAGMTPPPCGTCNKSPRGPQHPHRPMQRHQQPPAAPAQPVAPQQAPQPIPAQPAAPSAAL